MLRVGIAGIGFMGMIHYLAYQKVGGVKVVAIATRNAQRQAGDWRGIHGNFGPVGKRMDLGQIRRYAEVSELIEDPEIDVIDICLPPALHADVAIAALKAGKHVFCEKPIALRLEPANKMIAAARTTGKQLFIGHVLPFVPEYAFALKSIRTGRFGQVLGGHFSRIISDPLWIKDFYDPDRVGGPVIDLQVHDAHFIRLLFGMPAAVSSCGRMRSSVVEFVETHFLYPGTGQVVSARSGVINQQGRGFTHGFEIHCERGTLVFEFATFQGKAQPILPLTVLDQRGRAIRPKLGTGDELAHFAAEIKEVANCIRRGIPSTILDGSLACDALAMCHKQSESVIAGRQVKI